MSKTLRVVFFFVLPILAALFYPPQSLIDAITVVPVVLLFFIGLGILEWRGRHLALTFSIFVQGVNVIVRLMMFFSNSFSSGGDTDFVFIVTSLAGLILSLWLMIRLDRQDVHTIMIH